MTDSKSVRWGIIGTGDVADFKGGPALYQAERSELIAVTNRNPSKAEEFSKRHGDPEVCDTAEELVQRPDLDAIYIATPPSSHLSLVQLAAKHGKHVLVEKPMAPTVEQCQEMLDVCEKHSVSLVVAFYRRFFPVVQEIKRLLDSGAIGNLLSLSAITIAPFHLAEDAWRLDPELSGGGFMMDMGTHRFDLFTYLAGGTKRISGIAKSQSWSNSVDDAATISLEFDSGALGTAIFHWNSQINRDELQIVGSRGCIHVDDLSGAGRLTLEQFSNGSDTAHLKSWEIPSSAPVHLNLVEQIVAHLLDGKPNPCPGIEAMIATRIARTLFP